MGNKKFVACDTSTLGQTCETREQAERAAIGMDYYIDAMTGWSTAFNCEPVKYADVTEIGDRRISKGEYLRSEASREIAEEKFNEEVRKLRKKMLGKYKKVRIAYVNTNTPYNYGDKIRLVTRKENGRKRTIEGHVCGVSVEKDGEIRPCLRGQSYLSSDEILSIEVLERFDFQKVNRRVVCKNCKHFRPNDPHGYSLGYCEVHNKDVHCSNENNPCYINEPGKYDKE